MNIGVIFSNIIGFDGLIFIVAALNVYFYISARNAANNLYDLMHGKVYTPSYTNDISDIKNSLNSLTDRNVSALREKAAGRYTLYGNITGIFPLLGILGTVISLLGMVGDTSDVQGGFFAALTSTFWGLIFAIVFKFLDGFIAPKLEDGERAAELFMTRKAEGFFEKEAGHGAQSRTTEPQRSRSEVRPSQTQRCESPAEKYEIPPFSPDKYERPAEKYELPADRYNVPESKYQVDESKYATFNPDMYEVSDDKYKVSENTYAPDYDERKYARFNEAQINAGEEPNSPVYRDMSAPPTEPRRYNEEDEFRGNYGRQEEPISRYDSIEPFEYVKKKKRKK